LAAGYALTGSRCSLQFLSQWLPARRCKTDKQANPLGFLDAYGSRLCRVDRVFLCRTRFFIRLTPAAA